MSILCSVFGHKPERGLHWYGGNNLEVKTWCMDQVKRVHIYFNGRCERCGKMFEVGKIIRQDIESIGQEIEK